MAKRPPLKVYEYDRCSTCKKALRFLDEHEIPYEKVPIVDQPPTLAELKRMLGHVSRRGGDVRKLFNTSGEVYREKKLGAKLPGMSEAEALGLLAVNGKLIKRPFVLGDGDGVVGFKQDEWEKL